ncbi:MAG: hypothetical protein JNK11_20025 [Alphaproteobacteria bacterium]|nr:hypothetical protein [Alphaproteobacteria bacterium]
MPHVMKLPPLGQTIEEAKMAEWLVPEGKPVDKDEPLLVVETDKGNLEVNADAGGTVKRHLVKIGVMVKIGDAVAEIET